MKLFQSGAGLTIASAITYSLYPVVALPLVRSHNVLFIAGLASFIAAAFFAILITKQRTWHELARKAAWRPILGAVLLLSIGYHGLYQISLQFTSSGNASLMAQLEIFTTIAILYLLGHEKLNQRQLIGSACMLVGVVFLFVDKASSWQWGNLLVLGAVCLAPFGNRFNQAARKIISAPVHLFARSFIGGFFFLFLASLNHGINFSFTPKELGFLLLLGLIGQGLSKYLWIEAIHKIPVSQAIGLAAVGPAFTLVFAALFLGEAPTWQQLAALAPITVGVLLLTQTKRESTAKV